MTKPEWNALSPRMQKAVEDQIAALAASVAGCLDGERADPSGATAERKDAVRMVEATATLLQAVARVRGEFRHDYRVVRVNEGDPAPKTPKMPAHPAPEPGTHWSGRKEEELLTEEEAEALSDEEYVDYERWVVGLPPKYNGWKRPTLPLEPIAVPASVDPAIAELADEVNRVAASLTPNPPRISRFECRCRKRLGKEADSQATATASRTAAIRTGCGSGARHDARSSARRAISRSGFR